MDTSEYMGMFMDEAHEHLQTLNQTLLELEKDPNSLELIDEIFRVAHTLKGMAATMGFAKIADLTHKMENTLDKVRSDKTAITEDLVDLLFSCLDTLEALVNDIASGQDSNIDTNKLLDALDQLVSGSSEVAAIAEDDVLQQANEFGLNTYEKDIIQKAKEQNFNIYQLVVTINEDCLLKSARAYMVFKALEEIGEIVSSEPSVEDIEQERFEDHFTLILITKEKQEHTQETVLGISEIKQVDIKPITLDQLDDNQLQSLKQMQVNKDEDKADTAAKQQAKGTMQSKLDKIKTTQTVRVDIERLDYLNNLVQEMVISKTRLDQIKQSDDKRNLGETVEHIGRITTDLQDIVMKIRMVPIEQVFNRFPRMVRDLSKDLDKEINLVLEGQETELDRTIIDEIGDPLVHLLRNSIDHGLEPPKERKQKGKDPVGTIKLMAHHKGDSILIEVEDDGRGIDPQVIKAKAVEKGVISQREADELDEKAAVKLIFRPGFSTAKQVTEVSGRGVGLDAVEDKISNLGGFVDIETEKGKGSKFIIRLPLTLAIIQALLISVSNEIYAIPLSFIDETITMAEKDIKTIQNKETILLRGEVLPLMRLSDTLEAEKATAESKDDDIYIVIVRKGDERAGLVVDNLIGQQEVVIKTLGDLIGSIKGIAGATILGDGHVALILDIGGII